MRRDRASVRFASRAAPSHALPQGRPIDQAFERCRTARADPARATSSPVSPSWMISGTAFSRVPIAGSPAAAASWIDEAERLVPGRHHEEVGRAPTARPFRRVRPDTGAERSRRAAAARHRPVGHDLQRCGSYNRRAPPRLQQIESAFARKVAADEQALGGAPARRGGARRSIAGRKIQQHRVWHHVDGVRHSRIPPVQRVFRPARRRRSRRRRAGRSRRRAGRSGWTTHRSTRASRPGARSPGCSRSRRSKGLCAHEIEAGVGGRLAMEVEHVEVLDPAGGRRRRAWSPALNSWRKRARSSCAGPGAVEPELLAHGAADHAVEQRQAFGEQQLRASMTSAAGEPR